MEKAGEKMNDERYKKGENCHELPDDMKLCPFQSTPTHEVACTQRCALWRGNKQRGFECPVSELGPMAWHIAGKPQRGSYKRND